MNKSLFLNKIYKYDFDNVQHYGSNFHLILTLSKNFT